MWKGSWRLETQLNLGTGLRRSGKGRLAALGLEDSQEAGLQSHPGLEESQSLYYALHPIFPIFFLKAEVQLTDNIV